MTCIHLLWSMNGSNGKEDVSSFKPSMTSKIVLPTVFRSRNHELVGGIHGSRNTMARGQTQRLHREQGHGQDSLMENSQLVLAGKVNRVTTSSRKRTNETKVLWVHFAV